MRVLGVGIATLDIINLVDGYPGEDDEVRALEQYRARGGNITNTLVVLSQLGYDCAWAGMLADDAASSWVRDELAAYRINTEASIIAKDAVLPTSYVMLNKRNGSRTIVHFRDLQEYSFEAFQQIDMTQYDWIHFEGRQIPELEKMMRYLKQQEFHSFSLEVEKMRDGIDQLFDLPALLMFSRAYVRQLHADGVRGFFNGLTTAGINVPVYCAWGKAGGWAMDGQGNIYQQPAFQPEKVIDTLGAGDVFNAGVIDANLRQLSVGEVLAFACKVAGFKCGQLGFSDIAGVHRL